MQCFLNGEFLPAAQARISPLDRGFLFGDSVYEVVPVYRRQPFYRRRHLARLTQSLQKIRLPFDAAALEAPAHQLIAQCPSAEQALYIQITRGEMARRQLPFADAIKPTVFMAVWPRAAPAAETLQHGIRCRTVEDIRWARCDIKSNSLLGAALLASEAAADEEEVMIMRDGLLSEGSRGNFILVKDGALHTPLADARMLAGITAQAAIEVAQGCGIKHTAHDISAAEIRAADEIWLTSSLREILPVTSLDGKPVGGGKPGEVFRRAHAAWRRHIAGDEWLLQ